MSYQNAIVIWPFDKAPSAFAALSQHGGDEDWVAFVPDELKDEYIPFIENSGPNTIGCCDTSAHPVAGGTVYIGAHA